MPFNVGGNILSNTHVKIYNNKNIVRSGLVLYVNAGISDSYPGSGTTWTDLSGNSNNATLLNGPTFSAASGSSITFDGSNDYATFSNSIKGSNTDSFTIATMAKFPALNVGRITMARGFDQAGAYSEGWNLYLAFSSINQAQFGITTTSPSIASYTVSGTTTLSANTWYYLTGVWTAGSSLKIYLNGVLENTVSNTSTSLRNSTNGFVLGAVGVSAFYNSTIGTAQAYNRVLTQAEILQNFNAQRRQFGI